MFDSLQKKSDLGEVDSTTCFLLYPRFPPSNSASKYTTSSFDNLLETSSASTIDQPPRHKYNLRNNRNLTPSLASTNTFLLRHHDRSFLTDFLSLPDNAPTSGVDTAFSQRSSISSFETGHLFSEQISESRSFLSSDSLLRNIDLTTDQYSTPPTPNRIDYSLIVNDTLVNSSRQDPRFLYLAVHKLNSNRCRKEFQRFDKTHLEIKYELTAKFHNLSPHPIPLHTTVNLKYLPHPFIATNFSLFVSDHPPFRLLHGSITFLNTLTSKIHCSILTMFPLSICSFSYFLFCVYSLLPITFLTESSSDLVDPNDPHISDLLVSHYDCSKQHNLTQFSLTRVQPCSQAPSSFESTRAIVNVFVRAKAKRLKAWTCEAYVKREKFVCAQSDHKYRMTVLTITRTP